ncbi:MAG: histidine kinase [Rhodanobacter sp.]|nr:histidine kinase [Rhodanobacter sp.]
MNRPETAQNVSPPTQPSYWRLDLALVVALSVLSAFASAHWQVAEFLAGEFRVVENLQLDEAPGVLLVVAVGSLWYAWRRYREARRALAHSLRAEQQLAAALADNRRLVRQYAQVQETERARLSRELHDELGQYLNAVKIDAVSLMHLHEPAAAAIDEIAGSIVRNLDHVQAAVVGLIRQLRPVGLDELGIEAALEHCIAGWRERLPQAVLTLHCDGDLSALGDSLNLAVYRIVQEGLTNVVRHAHAARVDVRVWRAPSHARCPQLRIQVCDDGRGRDRDDQGNAGLGLIGMRERVEALGGELRIDTAPGRGFRLFADIPVAAESVVSHG